MPPRRSSRRARGPRPRYMWISEQLASLTAVPAGAQSGFDLFQSLQTAQKSGATLVRGLFRLWVSPTTSGQNVEFQHVLVMMDLDAFTAGAFPDPSVDIVNYYLHDGDAFRTDVDAGFPGRSYQYDIRAARRLRQQRDSCCHIIENTSAGNSLTYQIFSRLLVRLA